MRNSPTNSGEEANFGIDQSFVQRYHTAGSDRQAARSVWLSVVMYVPLSAAFFFIGTSLFAYYQTQPDELATVKIRTAEEQLDDEGMTRDTPAYEAALKEEVDKLRPADIGDKVFPHYIVSRLPPGVSGLLIAALFAAAMSSIDTSLNRSATIVLSDIYKRYVRPDATDRESMRVLYGATLAVGVAGTSVAVAMIGVQSVLEAWWKLSGILAGGMLGLFLLGMISRRARNPAAVTAVTVGVLAIAWMTLLPPADDPTESALAALRSPFHVLLTPVIGVLTILWVGLMVGAIADKRRRRAGHAD